MNAGSQPNLPLDRETIAVCAYLIWEKEGRPEGRAAQHWFEAEAQLRAMARAAKPPLIPAPPFSGLAKPGRRRQPPQAAAPPAARPGA